MKALKTMLVIGIVACMSTGCKHNHNHEDKSHKTEPSKHAKKRAQKSSPLKRHFCLG